jgi:hypothetical protein
MLDIWLYLSVAIRCQILTLLLKYALGWSSRSTVARGPRIVVVDELVGVESGWIL